MDLVHVDNDAGASGDLRVSRPTRMTIQAVMAPAARRWRPAFCQRYLIRLPACKAESHSLTNHLSTYRPEVSLVRLHGASTQMLIAIPDFGT